MDVKHLCELIDEKQNELYELLGSLIRINSESFGSCGNEAECAEYIYKLCADLGLESEIYSPLDVDGFEQHPDYVKGRNLKNRYNVTARWTGKENVDKLMLMGHIDTTEIGDRKNWSIDPLSGEIRDGKIYGRGACDDKYALAAILFIIKLLKSEKFIPKANLVFAAYSDEEYGGSHGAMASVMKYPCQNIVNMDGVYGQIWHCASGGQSVTYRYHTIETVDSAKKTAEAFPIIMEEIEKFRQRRCMELENNRFYAGTIIPPTSLRYEEIRAGNNGADMGAGMLRFTFYTDKTKEEIYSEFGEIEKILDKRLGQIGIKGDGFAPNTRFFHYGFCEPESENIKNMLKASVKAAGKELLVCGSCLSDLSVILKYGSTNAFAFGAGRDFSEEGGAHQPNEYLECSKFLEYTKTIAAYVLQVLQ